MADKVILSYHDALIHESDLQLLEGRNWLNDSLISFWFEHLHHEVYNGISDYLFISSEVTQLLKMGDPSELPLFLDPLNVRESNLIFFPVNDNSSVVSPGGSHWSLLVYSKPDNKWFHYDSQRGSNFRDARSLVQRMNIYLNNDDLPPLQDAQCTQQDNSYDCGAFVMIYAQKLSDMASKGLDISSCFVQRQEANQIRESILALVNSLKVS
ncbi:UNVERIFIED_CONTAM: hypothetical protein GTU68_001611 [Idotea baltica]|nr:hypothetical protein [Idotea baltica]